MKSFAPYMIRVTGVMVDDGAILIIKQKTLGREWFLPGGTLEEGETLAECVEREVFEETGFTVKAKKLISVADTDFKDPPLVHIIFTVEIDELLYYGFSNRFVELLKNDFKDAPSYAGRDPLFEFELN